MKNPNFSRKALRKAAGGIITAAVLLLLYSRFAPAQEPPPGMPFMPDPEMMKELMQSEEFKNLPPEMLEEIKKAMEMYPEMDGMEFPAIPATALPGALPAALRGLSPKETERENLSK